MSGIRNTSDPAKPAYDNPTRDKGGLTDLSHGGVPATGQNEKDAKRVRQRRSDRPIGHDSDKKLGEKPPRPLSDEAESMNRPPLIVLALVLAELSSTGVLPF